MKVKTQKTTKYNKNKNHKEKNSKCNSNYNINKNVWKNKKQIYIQNIIKTGRTLLTVAVGAISNRPCFVEIAKK